MPNLPRHARAVYIPGDGDPTGALVANPRPTQTSLRRHAEHGPVLLVSKGKPPLAVLDARALAALLGGTLRPALTRPEQWCPSCGHWSPDGPCVTCAPRRVALLVGRRGSRGTTKRARGREAHHGQAHRAREEEGEVNDRSNAAARSLTVQARSYQGQRSELRVELCAIEGRPFVSLRVWEQGMDGAMHPTKKGLTVRTRELAAVRGALAEAQRAVDAGELPTPSELPKLSAPGEASPAGIPQVNTQPGAASTAGIPQLPTPAPADGRAWLEQHHARQRAKGREVPPRGGEGGR